MTWDIRTEPVRGDPPDPRVAGLSGPDRMRFVAEGHAPRPPIHHLTGLRAVEGGAGHATFTMPITQWLRTSAGAISPGAFTFVADAALGAAVMSELGPGRIVTTSQVTMNFLRPAALDAGRLIARGRSTTVGHALGLSEVTVEDGSGRTLAVGSSRCFVQTLDLPQDLGPPEPAPARTYPTPDPYQRPAQGSVVDAGFRMTNSGLEHIQSMMKGVIPRGPISELVDMRPTHIEEGRGSLVMPASPWLGNPARMVYGGALALLLHSSLLQSTGSLLPAGLMPGPLDFGIHFVRPVPPDGRDLTAEGRVVYRGRNLIVSTGRVVNADGKTVALGTESSVIVPAERFDAGAVVDEATRTFEDEDELLRPM